MDLPQRERLPHNIPLWVDPQKSVYFITINCQERGTNQLAKPEIAGLLLDSVRFRNEKFIWYAHVFLVMPDHVHALLSFPPSENTIQEIVSKWKRWTARQLKIEWQRDFFEHRLRSDESWREKADYILANPTRKDLAKDLKDWPYLLFPKPR
ncbi:MAG: transposase [Verrucomicrobiota bacterium]|jgi:putative transposase